MVFDYPKIEYPNVGSFTAAAGSWADERHAVWDDHIDLPRK
jgi:hypothetical protein